MKHNSPDWIGEHAVIFDVTGANVYHVKQDSDTSFLIDKYPLQSKYDSKWYIDFEKMANDYDGLHFSGGNINYMHGWDAESTAWFNTSHLIPIQIPTIDKSSKKKTRKTKSDYVGPSTSQVGGIGGVGVAADNEEKESPEKGRLMTFRDLGGAGPNGEDKILFVYGTLRDREPNYHKFMENAKFLGKVKTEPRYNLVMADDSPGITSGESSIEGELYEVSKQDIEKIDQYEDPYVRNFVWLDGHQLAHAYFLPEEPEEVTEKAPHIKSAQSKTLLILRGVSGAGKSTYARKLQQEVPGSVIVSADQYFMNEKGEYKFDPSKLGQAHAQSLDTAIKAMKDGAPLVIVDNTNTQRWEFQKYVDAANDLGYNVDYKMIGGLSKEDVDLYTQRNVHGVPRGAIERMVQRFEVPKEDTASSDKASGVANPDWPNDENLYTDPDETREARDIPRQPQKENILYRDT